MIPLKASAKCLLVLGVLSFGATVRAQQDNTDGPGVPSDRGIGGSRQPSGDHHGSDPASGDERKAGGHRDVGAATEFFGTPERAGSFAYVLDRSGSMATRNALDVVKRELLASLEKLPPEAMFSVVFYNLAPIILADPQGHRGRMAATEANKAQVRAQLDAIVADGGTDHLAALRVALAEHSEVVFFLTDADLLNNGEIDEVIGAADKTRISVIEFGRGADIGGSVIRRLATATGGTYRYLDVTRFPR